MSKFVRELQVRGARFDMIQKVMREFEDSILKKNPDAGYAYLAGYLSTMITSLAADRLDTTEDLIAKLKLAMKIEEETV